MNDLLKYIKQYKDIALLNYIALMIYYAVFTYMGIEITDFRVFSTVDSQTYYATSLEFYKLSEGGYSEIRPFLYPLIILLSHKTVGIYGIWLVQFLGWLLSINLIYISIKRNTGSRTLGFTGSLVIAINISFIVLTTHALTESVTIFLLSVLVNILSKTISAGYTVKNFLYTFFVLILLTVTKPAFYIHALFLLFVLFPFFFLKKFIIAPKKILLLLACAIPLIFQVALMKVKYNTFTISNIDSQTFKPYLFSQGIKENNEVGIKDARGIALNMNASEVLDYLGDNKTLYLSIYLNNLKNAIHSLPCFILYENSYYQASVIGYMVFLNGIYFYLHIVFLLPLLFFLYRVYKKRNQQTYLFSVFFLTVLLYYLLLVAGMVFGEGDRLVLIALPLWVFLYALIINEALKKRRIRNLKH